jgi:predicted NACHT family NTPase
MPDFTVAAVASQIVTKGFEIIFSEIAKKIFAKSEAAPGSIRASHFKEHCSRTFDRCTKIKTLLSRDEPVDMLQQYVNIKLKVRRKGSDLLIDDFGSISEILDKRRVTIVGTAGSGKTVFMRYLWVSLFVGAESRIPVFLELRRLNSLTTVDIISFIFLSIVGTESKIDQASFTSLIDAGRFVFVLDGFDEVSIEKRDLVQAQILDLCARSKANVVVVSGRPDDRFDAWQEFSKYRVEPLELTQVVTLVERVSFDVSTKKRFTESLKNGLYKAHSSFFVFTPSGNNDAFDF